MGTVRSAVSRLESLLKMKEIKLCEKGHLFLFLTELNFIELNNTYITYIMYTFHRADKDLPVCRYI